MFCGTVQLVPLFEVDILGIFPEVPSPRHTAIKVLLPYAMSIHFALIGKLNGSQEIPSVL